MNPFDLPVHPAVVHFPIAMLSAAWVCVIVRHITGDERWSARSRLFEVVGVVALPVVIIAGFIDTRGFDFLLNPRADAPLIWHMTSGFVATIAFAVHYFWKQSRPVIDVGLSTFGVIAVFAAGLLGVEVVFG